MLCQPCRTLLGCDWLLNVTRNHGQNIPMLLSPHQTTDLHIQRDLCGFVNTRSVFKGPKALIGALSWLQPLPGITPGVTYESFEALPQLSGNDLFSLGLLHAKQLLFA